MDAERPLSALTLADLRERRSIKWRAYDPDVLPLWVAEMDVPLAPPIRAALSAAVERGDTGYADSGRLAEAFAGFAARRFGWSPEPATMSLVPDVMQGIDAVLRRVTRPGDGVVLNTPAYPPFFPALVQTGLRIIESPLVIDSGGRYRIDMDRLARDFAAGARAFLLCNPHNPTGTVFTREELLAVAELADRYDVQILSDEIHGPLTYPGVRFVPLLALADQAPAAARAFAFTSASKAWNLAGLKAALTVAGPGVRPGTAVVPIEVQVGSGLFGVLAGEAAFEQCDGWLDALRAGLDANRVLLAELLARELPAIRYRPPDGTYLAWLDCRALDLGDDPATVFLAKGRVALYPGPRFGTPGRGFARLNLATSPDLLREGIRRMAGAVSTAG